MLFLAPVTPWCRESGSSLIIADQLEGLVRNSQVEILAVFLRHSPCETVTPRPPLLKEATLGVQLLPRWASVIRAVLQGSTPMRMRFDTADIIKRVEAVLKDCDFAPTLVHAEHLPLVDVGAAIARPLGIPMVFRSHNNEAQLLGRRLGLTGSIGRRVLRRLERDEAKAVRRASLTLCISDDDTNALSQWVPDARVATLPCALDFTRYPQPGATLPHVAPMIGFVGGLDWEPNARGLEWFVREAFPFILRRVPSVRLGVLARGASNREWLRAPNIEVLDPASSAIALFSRSWITIAPLLEGGGVRIKIPESLAVGTPVVATNIGAEGHQLAGVYRADTPLDFAQACLEQLESPQSLEARLRLRADVEGKYSTEVVAARLVDSWQHLSGLASRE